MGLKLICCGESVKLDEFPANYSHQFIGRCKKCDTAFGIEDLTEISDEMSDYEDEND